MANILNNHNIRVFPCFEITEEEQKEIMSYACSERSFYYLFKYYNKIDLFYLFYLDRFFGWKKGEGGEEMMPAVNGFGDFIHHEILENKALPKGEVASSLYEIFHSGNKVLIPLWMKYNGDGELYITPVILEGMDQEYCVYYTKHSSVNRKCCEKFTKDEFLSKLAVNEDGRVHIDVVKNNRHIDQLAKMDFTQAYQYIFNSIFNYQYKENKILKADKEILFDLSGFENFIIHLKTNQDHILKETLQNRRKQLRFLYLRINNMIRPIQLLLKYVLDHGEVKRYIPIDLIEHIKENVNKIDNILAEVLKFASLLFQRQDKKSYEFYMKIIDKLYDELPEYQQINYQFCMCMLSIEGNK